MNSAQTIYTVFYALYFAVSISTTNNLKLFDTAVMKFGVTKYPKAWLRFGIGFLFVNIIPLFYFWIVINIFSGINGDEPIKNFWILLIIFLQSIIGFGFYRILFGILMIRKNGDFYFYDKQLYPENNPIEETLNSRIDLHRGQWAHIIPGLVWVVFTALLLIFIV